jgi:hypothetical protein
LASVQIASGAGGPGRGEETASQPVDAVGEPVHEPVPARDWQDWYAGAKQALARWHLQPYAHLTEDLERAHWRISGKVRLAQMLLKTTPGPIR